MWRYWISRSMNHLSGKIPAFIASLHFLSSFNVSYNNLQGPIPTSTQLQSFDASAFKWNSKLCGAPLTHECRKTKGTDANEKNNQVADMEHKIPWFYVSAALGFIVGDFGESAVLYCLGRSGGMYTTNSWVMYKSSSM
ncbi:putative leucine-rich repeat domain, L domain-containing protein [Rosa chinensis]|uniref:Putative leucine-rich repeat domain, L domain-containing protein n=1 Tax=Rosa chinensis TaxID=74649 RepID=A0A2P6QN25_ROSCH|nr:putative leucine-rich repeat domain, L domain-containing protein [Rosa chinensis]